MSFILSKLALILSLVYATEKSYISITLFLYTDLTIELIYYLHMNWIKFIRIFLLVLIIIGLGLLVTQKMWVPKLVNKIIAYQKLELVIEPINVNKVNKNNSVSNLKSSSFEWCMANGGDNRTPNYNAPKICVLNNRVYEENCVGNTKYFVIESDLTDSVGSSHLVKYKGNENQNYECKYVVNNGDLEIKNEWAEYILALENNFLILDSGTGPSPRGLIVYDLITRKKVYTDLYSKPVNIQNGTIDYWAESTEKATKENCQKFQEYEKDGLGSAIDVHISIDLKTLVKKELGEKRCDARQ